MADHDTHDHTGVTGVPAAATTVKLDDLATPDDNTDLNASTSRHGLLRKLDNNAAHYLDGQGGWTTPAGYAPGGTDVAVADGGTGSSTAAAARTALGVAWELISDTTLGSDTANFDLTSIPGTYKHLMIQYQMRSDRSSNNADSFGMRFNNDSSGNYDYTTAQHDGSAWYFGQTSGGAYFTMGEVAAADAGAGDAGAGVIYIANYAGTTWNKTHVTDGTCAFGTTAGQVRRWATSGKWRSTAAITRITLIPVNGSNFKTGSRVTLYGMS